MPLGVFSFARPAAPFQGAGTVVASKTTATTKKTLA